jgi:RNA recognition motif-containing protein
MEEPANVEEDRRPLAAQQRPQGPQVEASSRIIVKNLPKHMTQARFRDIFGSQGEITDVKLAKLPWVSTENVGLDLKL